jgi:uncharacterized protein YggT (Ycf19 family)
MSRIKMRHENNNIALFKANQPHSHSSSEALLHNIHETHHALELLETILDAAATTGHSVGKLLETCCRQIPALGVIIDSLGNAAAVIKFRYDLGFEEKRTLGIKVVTGFIALGLSIAAISLPHLTLALTIAGLATNLISNLADFYDLHREKKSLEKQCKSLATSNPEKHALATEKLTTIKQQYNKQRKKVIAKAAKISFSTILLVGFIATLANPVTAAPAAIIIAISAVVYTGFKYRKQIKTILNKVADKALNVFDKVKAKAKTLIKNTKQQFVNKVKKPVKSCSLFFKKANPPKEEHEMNKLTPYMTRT